jgi:hypothetical protein
VSVGKRAIEGVNYRSLHLDQFEQADRYAVDLYGAVQDAYLQTREHRDECVCVAVHQFREGPPAVHLVFERLNSHHVSRDIRHPHQCSAECAIAVEERADANEPLVPDGGDLHRSPISHVLCDRAHTGAGKIDSLHCLVRPRQDVLEG